MKKIIIITSNSIRHRAFRVFLSNYKNIKILLTISEKGKNNINNIIKKKSEKNFNISLQEHLDDRNQIERDFFDLYLKKLTIIQKIYIKIMVTALQKNF